MSIAETPQKNENISKIQDINQESILYPKLLKQIHHPPKKLFFRGNLDKLNSLFPLAVVGSRKVSDYGKEAIAEIISGLPKNVAIISGLALGADGQAHECALRHNLYTLAVLGSGIGDNNIYPRSNYNLAKRILDSGGCILSEYPPGTDPAPYNFPARNRIIAGISKTTLVAEASSDSGSLITADFALQEGRDVWSIPGPISSPLSEGSNMLIFHGAMPAINSKVILDEYAELSAGKEKPISVLSLKILEELRSRKSCLFDDLLNLIDASFEEMNSALTELEIAGKIIFDLGVYKLANLTESKNH